MNTIDLSRALEQFRQGPAILRHALEGCTAAELDVVPAPGKWTIRQIVRHLADTEIVAGMRMRQILAEDRPTLLPFDHEKWASDLHYDKADLSATQAVFELLRNDVVKVLDAASEESFARVGVHPDRGEKSLCDWVVIFGRHVETHASQIRQIRQKCVA